MRSSCKKGFSCKNVKCKNVKMIILRYVVSELKRLNQWIRTNTELSARLAATGYITTQRRFTPQQVKLLYHYLGEPF